MSDKKFEIYFDFGSSKIRAGAFSKDNPKETFYFESKFLYDHSSKNFEIQKIRHCSRKVINGSRQFDVTKENIDKMFSFDLFDFENYCKVCPDMMPRRPDVHRTKAMNKLIERGEV